jgi:hypothetical protein
VFTVAHQATLLSAVPSFAPIWAAHWADHLGYVARFPDEALSEAQAGEEFLSRLASYLGGQIARGAPAAELGWLFAALEPIYRAADEALRTALTIGFLESVIYAAEGKGGTAAGVGAFTAGPETAAAWRTAYEYIHPPEQSSVR